MELTTLQLARKIADAVGAELDNPHRSWPLVDLPDHEHPPTQAVLRTLRETGSWFCRLREDENRCTVQEQYELFPASGA